MIDLDELGIFITHADTRLGKALFGRWVREVGNYGHGHRINLLKAISFPFVPTFHLFIYSDQFHFIYYF